MKEWAELIKAISSLLWPTFAIVSIFIFKEEISRLLARIKKGKLLGQEIELEESLRQLNIKAIAAVSEVDEIPKPESVRDQAGVEYHQEDPIKAILDEVSRSPQAGLLLLSAEIEKAIRHIWAYSGLINKGDYGTIHKAISVLSERDSLPKNVVGSLNLFWDIRNKIIHGSFSEDRNIYSAIDSGIHVLKAVKAIPHETHSVYHPGVDVYGDPEGNKLREGVKAVILETTSPGGSSKTKRVYPSTCNHFIKGKKVAWEWNDERRFNESWYRDPDTDEIKYGWSSSMEFVGRKLDEL